MSHLYVQLGLTLTALAIVTLASSPVLPLTVALSSWCTVFWCRVRVCLPAAMGAAAMALVLFLVQALTAGGEPSVVLFGRLPLYREGLERGLMAASRIAGGVSALLLFGGLLGAGGLGRLVLGLPVPAELTEIFLTGFRFVGILREELGRLLKAQRARLGYRGTLRALASASVTTGILLLRAYDRGLAQERARRMRGGRTPAVIRGIHQGEFGLQPALALQAAGLAIATLALIF